MAKKIKGPSNRSIARWQKQRFNSPQQAARVKYPIGYIDQTSALHPGITLHEMSELMAQDFKVAIGVVPKDRGGYGRPTAQGGGPPKVSKA